MVFEQNWVNLGFFLLQKKVDFLEIRNYVEDTKFGIKTK